MALRDALRISIISDYSPGWRLALELRDDIDPALVSQRGGQSVRDGGLTGLSGHYLKNFRRDGKLRCFNSPTFLVDYGREKVHEPTFDHPITAVEVRINSSSFPSAAPPSMLCSANRAPSRRFAAPPTCKAAAAFTTTNSLAASRRAPESTERMIAAFASASPPL